MTPVPLPHNVPGEPVSEVAPETVTALVLRSALLKAQELGVNAEQVLRDADAPLAVLVDNSLRLTGEQADRVWEVVLRAVDGAPLGFMVGVEVDPTQLGPVALLGASASNLAAAMHYAERYSFVLGRQRYHVREDDAHIHLSMNVAFRPFLPSDPPVAELSTVAWTRLAQRLGGAEVRPVHVRFRHRRPRHGEEMEEYFGCPVDFDAPEPCLTFRLSDAKRPSPYSDPTVAAMLAGHADGMLARLSTSPTMADEVLRHVHFGSELREVSAENTSAALGVSTRTLFRKLKAEGDSFQALVDRVRHQHCLARMDSGGVVPSELSAQLGFSETSSFYRAFRRWTGRSFAEFRQERDQSDLA